MTLSGENLRIETLYIICFKKEAPSFLRWVLLAILRLSLYTVR